MLIIFEGSLIVHVKYLDLHDFFGQILCFRSSTFYHSYFKSCKICIGVWLGIKKVTHFNIITIKSKRCSLILQFYGRPLMKITWISLPLTSRRLTHLKIMSLLERILKHVIDMMWANPTTPLAPMGDQPFSTITFPIRNSTS